MTATLTTDPRTATYEDVERFLHAIAWKFAKRHDKDADDCLSVVNEAYLKAYDDFDPARGHKFITMVGHYAFNALRDFNRSEIRRRREMTSYSGGRGDGDANWMQTVPDTCSPEFVLDDVAADTRLVAELAIAAYQADETATGAAAEIAARAKEKGGYKNNWRSTIREYLAGLGWAATRIAESFDEIRVVLSR